MDLSQISAIIENYGVTFRGYSSVFINIFIAYAVLSIIANIAKVVLFMYEPGREEEIGKAMVDVVKYMFLGLLMSIITLFTYLYLNENVNINIILLMDVVTIVIMMVIAFAAKLLIQKRREKFACCKTHSPIKKSTSEILEDAVEIDRE